MPGRRGRHRLALQVGDRARCRCAPPCRRRRRTCRAGRSAWSARRWRSTTIQVSTVVAAHWMSPEAMARWRSFCGIFLIVTSSAVLLEDAGLLGQRQRREAGPAAHADGDVGRGLRRADAGRQCGAQPSAPIILRISSSILGSLRRPACKDRAGRSTAARLPIRRPMPSAVSAGRIDAAPPTIFQALPSRRQHPLRDGKIRIE